MNRNIAIVGGVGVIIICIILTVLLSGCITRGHPDVIPVEDSLSATQTGGKLTVSGEVKNIGNATAHNTRIRFIKAYHRGYPVYSTSVTFDIRQDLGDINPDETVSFKVSGKKPGVSDGTVEYSVCIYSEEDNWVYHSSKSFTRGLERVE